MKKILIFFFCFCMFTTYGQGELNDLDIQYTPAENSIFNTKGSLKVIGSMSRGSNFDGNSCIKLEYASFLTGNPAIEFERKIFQNFTISAGIGMTFFPNQISYIIRQEYSDMQIPTDLPSAGVKGLYLKSGVRIYGTDAFNDYFLELYASRANYSLRYPNINYQYGEENITELGLMYGFAETSSNGFYFEFSSGAAGRLIQANYPIEIDNSSSAFPWIDNEPNKELRVALKVSGKIGYMF